MAGFTFDGVQSSSFLLVNRVGRTTLPPITPKLLSITGRPGAYDFGSEIGVREFSIDVTIISTSDAALAIRRRDLADWLFTDKPAALVFNDEPDKTYYAKLSGDTALETLVAMGFGAIKFVCPDPFAYGPEVSATLPSSTSTVTNDGYASSYPVITARFAASTEYFAIGNGKKSVVLGETAVTKAAVPWQQSILFDDGSDLTKWQASGSLDDYDGANVATGTFEVFGGYAYKGSTFGDTATNYQAWHGPVVKRALPEQLQDFTVSVVVECYSTMDIQVGRVGFNLIDQNGAVMGNFFLKDASSTVAQGIVQASIGPNGDKTPLHYGEPGWMAYTNKPVQLIISRIGKVWKLQVFQVDLQSGQTYWGLTETWTDTTGKYNGLKLAQIQIAAYAYKAYDHTYSLFVHSAQVYKENALDTSTQTGHIAEAGDVITIDCEKAAVFKNGIPALKLLDPVSEFFALEKGPNDIAYLTTDGGVSVVVKHKGRWL